jgi:tRNA-guanine family transglycosylase
MTTKRDESHSAKSRDAEQKSRKTLRLLLHTVDGAIPYLTPHLLELCFPAEKVKDILWIGLAVRDACIAPIVAATPQNRDHKSNDRNGSINGSTSSKPKVCGYSFSPRQIADESTLIASKNHVMVWTDNGRQKLSYELYNAAAKGLDSHASITLFDAMPEKATARRRRAALERTNLWREERMQEQAEATKDDGELWASCLILPLNQGKEEPEVEQQFVSLKKALANQSIAGVAFVNWQLFPDAPPEESVLQQSIQRLEIGASSLTQLMVTSTSSLQRFLDCFHLGINIIGTNLPAQWAKEQKAFLCDITSWKKNQPKRPRLQVPRDLLDKDCCFSVLSGSTANDGKGGAWIRDSEPLLPGCSCLACKQHSRAYIYHLAMTKELLGETMLFIHNLHHMIALCRTLSESRVDGNDEDLYQHVQAQINKASSR